MGLALLLVGFAPAWGWTLAGCLLLGVAFYMLHNTLQVHATQMAPQRRGAAVAAFSACFFLGQFAGVSLAALAVERAGIAPVLAGGAAGLFAVAAAFDRWLRRHRRSSPPASAAGREPGP
jgi:predicted MFS family arabinose efflux permease